MKKVLILEDEVNIRSFVVINLRRAGYDVIEAGTGQDALDRLAENPDIGVAILDIMLPDIDGFEVCRRIRATSKQIGIIMLTARTQEMDKVTGLMTGADDYVTKPFSPAELTARIDALYRRIGGDSSAGGGAPKKSFRFRHRAKPLPAGRAPQENAAVRAGIRLIKGGGARDVREILSPRVGSLAGNGPTGPKQANDLAGGYGFGVPGAPSTPWIFRYISCILRSMAAISSPSLRCQ